jgi:predicted dehydrogenase
MHRIQLGLIGSGLIVQNRHLPALQALKDKFEIVAVYSRHEEHARALAAKLGRPAIFTDYRRLLEQPHIEAVDIAIPIALNYEVCLSAAQAGKHIICEKPIAANLRDAVAATRIAQDYKTVYMIAENFRYSSDMRQARQWIAGGAIGAPMLARWTVVRAYDPNNMYIKTAWRQQPAHPGGYLTDAGVHYMDVLHAILGPTELAQGFVSGHYPILGPEDTAVMNFRMAGGAPAHMTMSWATTESVNLLEIFGKAGMVRLVNDEVTLLRPGQPPQSHKDSGSQGFREEFEDFYAAVVEGKPLQMTPADALLDFAALLAALESAKTGKVINVKEFIAGA